MVLEKLVDAGYGLSPATELYVEFRGGPVRGYCGELLMEFYVKGVEASWYPCLCGRGLPRQPEPKPYWLVYPDPESDFDSLEVARATHMLLESLLATSAPNNILPEGLHGVQARIEQITRQCEEHDRYARTVWWSWISRVRLGGTPVYVRKCRGCSTMTLSGEPVA